EWVHVQLHQQKGMISLSPPTICNSAQIARQLHVIGFCNIATIIQFLLSGQKIDGHTGLPA
ncbi:hypothetical protein RZP77_28505, partial [Klebsiella grimontii]|nr:hypothetical protein [Klebsiella grimontii]MDV1026793.1 hypothetical protein [Klebsiella grimontii]MDV1043339.1 hypothetical protein [Klebsiella grimontii]MDV1107807.1 hypothetical protein [Klebsiella grimontii]MDV1118179.1 hypothetical protein [Klebsiella grimontii]